MGCEERWDPARHEQKQHGFLYSMDGVMSISKQAISTWNMALYLPIRAKGLVHSWLPVTGGAFLPTIFLGDLLR